MKFCFVWDFVYINSINKLYYEDKNNRTEHLRSNLRQHLSRWLFLPCTSKSSGGNNQQELLKNEEGRCLQKQTEEILIDVLPEEVKTWMLKRLGLFYLPS
jgi:hypothetical protein